MFKTLEFLTATSGLTLTRERGDVREHALEFQQQDWRWKGWKAIEYSPPFQGTGEYEMWLDDQPITHCSLCFSERIAPRMWRYVCNLEFYRLYQISQPRVVPWLVVHLLDAAFEITFATGRLPELADLETIVAWNIMDRHR